MQTRRILPMRSIPVRSIRMRSIRSNAQQSHAPLNPTRYQSIRRCPPSFCTTLHYKVPIAPSWLPHLHLHTSTHTSCISRDSGWRIHCGVEVTESSTNNNTLTPSVDASRPARVLHVVNELVTQRCTTTPARRSQSWVTPCRTATAAACLAKSRLCTRRSRTNYCPSCCPSLRLLTRAVFPPRTRARHHRAAHQNPGSLLVPDGLLVAHLFYTRATRAGAIFNNIKATLADDNSASASPAATP